MNVFLITGKEIYDLPFEKMRWMFYLHIKLLYTTYHVIKCKTLPLKRRKMDSYIDYLGLLHLGFPRALQIQRMGDFLLGEQTGGCCQETLT